MSSVYTAKQIGQKKWLCAASEAAREITVTNDCRGILVRNALIGQNKGKMRYYAQLNQSEKFAVIL